MNLKNKTDKELWDMLDAVDGRITGYEIDNKTNYDKEKQLKYNIHQEIIRREKDNE